MATVQRTFIIEECPHCNLSHRITVEVTLRREAGATATHESAQILSVCKSTGGGFFAAVEIDIPAGKRFGRIRAVTFANG
jgi:hypothetical protein